MVRRKDDERRIPASRFLQKPNQSSKFRIDPAHQSVVNRLQPPEPLLVVGRSINLAGKLMREPRMLTGFIFRRGQAREARHLRGIVHRVVRLGRDERRMRPQERQVRDERTARALDVVDRFADQERGVVEFRGIPERLRMRRAVFVVGTIGAIAVGEANVRRHLETVSLEPIGPRRRRADHQAHRPDAGQRAFVTLEPRIIGVERARILAGVGVAEQHGIVAERRGLFGPVGVARIERRAVGAGPMILQVHPGVNRRAARTAWRGVGVVTAEEHAVGRERVEIRRAHTRMAER